MVTTGRCTPVTTLARAWAPAFDTDPTAPASEGLPCAVDCLGDGCWGTAALCPEPGDDTPLSPLDSLGVPALDTPGAPTLGIAAPLPLLDLL